ARGARRRRKHRRRGRDRGPARGPRRAGRPRPLGGARAGRGAARGCAAPRGPRAASRSARRSRRARLRRARAPTLRGVTLRTDVGAWTLVRTALGGPREVGAKLGRVGRTARLWLDRGEVERRLDALARHGLAPACPSRLQLLFGGLDMLRFLIEP